MMIYGHWEFSLPETFKDSGFLYHYLRIDKLETFREKKWMIDFRKPLALKSKPNKKGYLKSKKPNNKDKNSKPIPMKIDNGSPGNILLFLTNSIEMKTPIRTPATVKTNGMR